MLVALGGCTTAQEPYTFNKTNTSLDTFKADSADCATLASETKGPKQSYQPGVGGLVVGSIAGGIQRGQFRSINYDNCMASKGYQKYTISGEEQQVFRRMSKAEKEAQQAEWLKRAN